MKVAQVVPGTTAAGVVIFTFYGWLPLLKFTFRALVVHSKTCLAL